MTKRSLYGLNAVLVVAVSSVVTWSVRDDVSEVWTVVLIAALMLIFGAWLLVTSAPIPSRDKLGNALPPADIRRVVILVTLALWSPVLVGTAMALVHAQLVYWLVFAAIVLTALVVAFTKGSRLLRALDLPLW